MTYGSQDSDRFSYDLNTGRMTEYDFTVGSTPQTMVGSLSWNPNGTLNTFAIIDPFNASDTQTCGYGHDDLSRLSSVSCGSENTLPNPDFELGNTGWGLSAAFSIVNNLANAQSGSWYLQGSSTSQGGANADNHQWVSIAPNSVLHYGGWINRVAGTGAMWWDCEVVDSNYNFVTWCNPAGLGDGSAGAGWNFYENSVTVPSNAAYVTFYAEIHGGGDTDKSLTTGYFDNATFTSSTGIWQQAFTYDAFGNISKSGTAAWLPNYTNTKNQYLQGWNGASYDGNGNLLNDTFNTYTWDVYGDMASVNTITPTYDAFGRLVEVNNGTQYIYSAAAEGAPLAQVSNQALVLANVRLPGGGSAIYDTSSQVTWYAHPDWLGSTRLLSDPNRRTHPTMAYAPFAEGYAGGDSGFVLFTANGYAMTSDLGYDQGGSLIDFMFRHYNPAQGRWISPDPAGLAAVDPTNPQTWNRYAYVANNPLSFVDPMGLYAAGPGQCDGPSGDGCGGGGGAPADWCPGCLSFGMGEINQGLGSYLSWINSMWAAGGSSVTSSVNGLAYSIDWSIDGGAVYVAPNGETLGASDIAELSLTALSGADTPDYSLTGPGSTGSGPGGGTAGHTCQAKILNATNKQFGTNYTNANVNSTFNYSTGALPGQGTLNLNIYGSTAGVSTGYYPVNWWTYVIGYGPTLHVVSGPGGHGGLDSQLTLPFGPNQATFHIDSGYVYNPSGAFFHWLLNMTKVGGYPQC